MTQQITVVPFVLLLLSRGSGRPSLALVVMLIRHLHHERQQYQGSPFASTPNACTAILFCDLSTAVTMAAPGQARDRQFHVTDAVQITALRQRITQVQRTIPIPVAGSRCSTCGQDTVCSTCGNCHYCDDINLPCATLPRIAALSESHKQRDLSTAVTMAVAMAAPGQARDHQLSVTDAAAIEAPVRHNRTSSCNAMALLPRIDEVLAAIEQHSFATQQEETDDE